MKKLQKSVLFIITDAPALAVLGMWAIVSQKALPFFLFLGLAFIASVIGLYHILTGDVEIDKNKN